MFFVFCFIQSVYGYTILLIVTPKFYTSTSNIILAYKININILISLPKIQIKK